jgi:hypothetical protein
LILHGRGWAGGSRGAKHQRKLDRRPIDRLLESVTFQITDLPGMLLGQTLGTTVLIDRDAAGFGWFVDHTPWADEEYSRFGPTHGLVAVPGGPADQRMDLLTVVMHELGHVLGYDHSDTGLMQPTLALGVRYLWEEFLEGPLQEAAGWDAYFAELGGSHAARR